jgi:FkbM family methyltransferase
MAATSEPGTSAQAEQHARWIVQTLGGLAGDVVVDVGANVGTLSDLLWRHADPRTRLVSIEPLPENLAVLRARCEAAACPRWRVEACAVSDREGTTWLEVEHTDAHGWNSAVRGTPGAGRVEVPCRTLFSLVEDATIVKLDVEGHEYAILDQALPAAHRVRAWVLELHKTEGRPLERTLGALADRGYRLRAAGRRPDAPDGDWQAFAVPQSLTWEPIPVARTRADGSIFKMLHLIALR